jgi:hypothetical protein
LKQVKSVNSDTLYGVNSSITTLQSNIKTNLTDVIGTSGDLGGSTYDASSTLWSKYKYLLSITPSVKSSLDTNNTNIKKLVDNTGNLTTTNEVVADHETRIDTLESNSNITKITWSNLKDLRDASGLVTGHSYEITDYVATKEVFVSKALHDLINTSTNLYIHNRYGYSTTKFHIIVTATSEKTLSEEARMVNAGSEYYDSSVDKWKIWYCLDNDSNCFEVGSHSSTGVIYRMIDDYGNDAPYDFKSLVFYTSITTATNMYRTFGYFDTTGQCCGNVIKPLYVLNTNDDENTQWLLCVNCNYVNTTTGAIQNNTFDYDCYNNVYRSYENTFGKGCFSNTVYGFQNIFGNNCKGNGLSNSNANRNVLGNYCYSNTITSYGNTLGNYCYSNSLSNSSYSYRNRLGDGCFGNIVYGYCNVLNNHCSYNYIDSRSTGNMFDNNCFYNKIGTYSHNNKFGSGCQRNSIGTNSTCNEFGKGCKNNALGDTTYTNPSTAVTNPNIMGYSSSYFSDKGGYYMYCKFCDGVSYTALTLEDMGSSDYLTSAKNIRNITIHKGIHGGLRGNMSSNLVISDTATSVVYETYTISTTNPYLVLYVDTTSQDYEINYGIDKEGNIVQWSI